MSDLERSVDRLTEEFERLSHRLDAANSGSDADRFTRHIKRYLPFYALATIWLLIIVILPVTKSGNDASDQANQVTTNDTTTPGAPSEDGIVPDASTAPTTGGTQAAPDGVDAPGTPAGFNPVGWNLTGKTIGGVDCKPGVRQIPWSAYAAPCYPKWSGNNGGATTRGVTPKEIIIVDRRFPESADSQAIGAITAGAGVATAEVTRAARNELVKFFNKMFELWGRKVKLIDYESQFGDNSQESLDQGKEGACADANVIVNELKAFGVVTGSGVFAECAAERKLVVFSAANHYPEKWYKARHPYAWNRVMECERALDQAAEYIGKRLAHRPAKWAKGTEKGKPRKFAMWIPNNDGYQGCGDVLSTKLKKEYNEAIASRFNYALDIARVADESTRAMVQFKAAGATSILLACDPISPLFLTQAAKAQVYYPEWILLGVALTDLDIAGRTWEQDEVKGSLFGMSQLGSNGKIFGKDGEMPKTYKAATGTNIAYGTDGDYFIYLPIFDALQATGPALTPHNLAKGYTSLPPSGGPRYEVGYWSWQDAPNGKAGGTDHTAIDDSREIYYDSTATGFDGKKGAYIETMGGKRFRNGQWPKGEPQISPK